MGAPIFLAEQGRVQISPAAQHQPPAVRPGLRGPAGDRDAAGRLHGLDIALHPPGLAGELDQGTVHASSGAPASRIFTRAAMSSTAPWMPVTLELRVRSYRRISPQSCPV